MESDLASDQKLFLDIIGELLMHSAHKSKKLEELQKQFKARFAKATLVTLGRIPTQDASVPRSALRKFPGGAHLSRAA